MPKRYIYIITDDFRFNWFSGLLEQKQRQSRSPAWLIIMQSSNVEGCLQCNQCKSANPCYSVKKIRRDKQVSKRTFPRLLVNLFLQIVLYIYIYVYIRDFSQNFWKVRWIQYDSPSVCNSNSGPWRMTILIHAYVGREWTWDLEICIKPMGLIWFCFSIVLNLLNM